MKNARFRDLFDLKDKVAVITGGGSGIGRAVALAFGEYGAKVAVVDIDLAKADATAAEVKALPGEAIAVKTDVTDATAINAMVRSVVETYGRIDILFDNAGRGISKPAVDISRDDWDRVIELNLTGMFLCAQAVGKLMLKQGGGKIVITGSVSSALGHPNAVSYAASKHGVVGMMKVLANEWAPHNINVNAIGPGIARTPMTERIFADRELHDRMAQLVPMGRLGETDDLVGAAIFLSSAASDYITGQIIYIDGGRLVD